MNWTSFRARKGRQVGDVVLWGKVQGSRVKGQGCGVFCGGKFFILHFAGTLTHSIPV